MKAAAPLGNLSASQAVKLSLSNPSSSCSDGAGSIFTPQPSGDAHLEKAAKGEKFAQSQGARKRLHIQLSQAHC